MIIAIDGTAASGKGTLGRILAAKLGLGYLDTGKIYRYVGIEAKKRHLEEVDIKELVSIVEGVTLEKLSNPGLNSAEASKQAAKYSPIGQLRQAALNFQRNFALKPPGMILDGRDIGTVVLPNADVKFFVDAKPEIRALRRYRELSALNSETRYDEVLRDLIERDDRDRTRQNSPLKPAIDAYLLDTTNLDVDATVAAAIAIVEAKKAR